MEHELVELRGRATAGVGVARPGDGETAEVERCLAAYDRRKAAGEDLSYEAIAAEAGTSSTPVRVALAMRRAEERIVEKRLAETAQQRFDRLLKKALVEQEDRVREQVAREVSDWWEHHMVAPFAERLARMAAIEKAHKGVIDRTVYRKLLAFLHPDSHLDDVRKSRAEDLFVVFKGLEDILVKDAERPSTLPPTLADLLARKARYDEEQRAKRAAAKAARVVKEGR